MPLFRPPSILIPKGRYKLPYGNILYLPLRDMVVGVSPNLLSNPGFEDGTTDYNLWRSTIASETGTIHSGTKSLKVTANDGAGAGTSFANQDKATTKYTGITSTLSAWYNIPNTNLLNSAVSILDGVGETVSSALTKDDAWHQVVVTRKNAATATYSSIYLYVKTGSTANTTDIAYFDDLSLTVPQMLSKDSYSRICHPEGGVHVAKGFSFDGIDDLLTFESDFIGTSACTIRLWLYPTNWSADDTYGTIIDNGKLSLIYSKTNAKLLFYSAYANSAVSANNSISLNKWQYICITRNASGVANIYIGDKTTKPALSGSADQTPDAPVSGTKTLTLFNRIAGDKGTGGIGDEFAVWNRVLNYQSEIIADWAATKDLF